MARIYKILARTEWEQARSAGAFAGSAVDLADGYIHFSTAAQAQATAAKWFAGQEDLVVLEIEADDLPDLKWEPARGGDLFPHLYRPLEAALVRAVRPAPLDPSGVPQVGAAS
jgi:uncharacterized protein (DUF952 family)